MTQKSEEKNCTFKGFMVLQQHTYAHNFNAKIDFKKYAPSPKILSKKSVQNQPSKPNQQNLTHFGRYRETRCIFFKTDWNRESKPVDLNTMNPISWFFFKEVRAVLKNYKIMRHSAGNALKFQIFFYCVRIAHMYVQTQRHGQIQKYVFFGTPY